MHMTLESKAGGLIVPAWVLGAKPGRPPSPKGQPWAHPGGHPSSSRKFSGLLYPTRDTQPPHAVNQLHAGVPHEAGWEVGGPGPTHPPGKGHRGHAPLEDKEPPSSRAIDRKSTGAASIANVTSGAVAAPRPGCMGHIPRATVGRRPHGALLRSHPHDLQGPSGILLPTIIQNNQPLCDSTASHAGRPPRGGGQGGWGQVEAHPLGADLIPPPREVAGAYFPFGGRI